MLDAMSNLTHATALSSGHDKEEHAEAPMYELQDVIQQFKAHPDLLKLILTSKVEEDKRRAEEAKLRAKELDYYLKHDASPPPPAHQPLFPLDDMRCATLPPISSRRKMPLSPRASKERHNPYAPPSPSMENTPSTSSSSTSTLMPTASSPLLAPAPAAAPSTSSLDQRRHSAAAAMLAMGNSLPPSPPTHASSDHYASSQGSVSDEEIDTPTTQHSAYMPSIKVEALDEGADDGKPRRRREMQAITKIVETREMPYMDNYFWRNNGNTTQKKTGCRSIYYKCSNSNKGCPVNKTVTERPNGEYLIKYRGNHLAECNMVERIRDV
ncbi:hypothetical protein BC940DRAFT_301105 [Gongronella butleri]|nr:hypothetical protein BC940DRAFT_301105 [Gongronella butleri]